MIPPPPPTPWEKLWRDTEPLLPLLILDALILIVAVVRRRRHPRASALAITGSGFSVLLMVGLNVASAFFPPHEFGYLKTFNILWGLMVWILALSHGLIGVAVFVERPRRAGSDQAN